MTAYLIQIIRNVSSSKYYFATNLQGDVIQLVDGTGAAVAAYEYDPFGNIVSKSGDLADLNPLRYRGYHYDAETGFYYLQSRYYDPKIGRFINADGYASTGQGIIGYNMFVYCGSNPVNRQDPSGCAYNGISPQINYTEHDKTYGGLRENFYALPECVDPSAFWVIIGASTLATITVVAIGTFGAGSIAGIATISLSTTSLAKVVEICNLQGRKSYAEGKTGEQIVSDIFGAIYDNGMNVLGLPSLSKMGTTTYTHIRFAFDEMRFDISQPFFKTLGAPGKSTSYLFSAIAWFQTLFSIFSDDPQSTASERGYTLR